MGNEEAFYSSHPFHRKPFGDKGVSVGLWDFHKSERRNYDDSGFASSYLREIYGEKTSSEKPDCTIY